MKRFLLLVLLLSFATADELVEPKLVTDLQLEVKDTGNVIVHGGDFYSVDLNLTMPQNTDYQSVQYAGPTVKDSEGNNMVSIHSDSPPNPFTYSLVANVQTTQRTTKQLKQSYSIPAIYTDYTKPSALAQSNSKEVKELAEEITEDAENDFEKIAMLAIYTNNYIEYDWDLIGAKKDALWVLNNKRGVCVEYSNLFTALARSQGYPVRYVLGQAYGSYGWLGHAWTEVYLGQWVPVDATWMEVGHLDATHIPFLITSEPVAENTISARVSSSANIEWEKHDFAGEETDQTQITIEEMSKSEEADYDLKAGATSLGFGEKTVVYTTLSADDYRVIDARLVSCQADVSIVEVPTATQYSVLWPGKKRNVFWVVETGTNLKNNILYTCPLTLNSNYLEENGVSIEARGNTNSPTITASLAKSTLGLGESQTVYIETVGGVQVTLITESTLQTKESVGQPLEFSFEATNTGLNEIAVFTSEGGAETLKFNVEKESADVRVTEVSVPDAVSLGSEFDVSVSLENKLGTPATVAVVVAAGEEERTVRVVIDSTATVQTSFRVNSPNQENLIVQVVEDNVVVDQVTKPLNVRPSANVTLLGVGFTGSGKDRVVAMTFKTNGPVEKLFVRIGDKTFAASGNTVTFPLTAGDYVASVMWEDNSGAEYSSSTMLSVPVAPSILPPGITDVGLNPLQIAVIGGLLLLCVLITGVFVFFSLKKPKTPESVRKELAPQVAAREARRAQAAKSKEMPAVKNNPMPFLKED